MKVFEYYFNPNSDNNRFLKAFSFEPEKPKERQFGNLYIIGELTNALPSNSSFLQKLANLIHEEYLLLQKSQRSPGKDEEGEKATAQVLTPEKALKGALRKANRFLAMEAKSGNVDWIGNLHFAVLLLVQAKGKDGLYFTKTGSMSVWMTRSGTIADVGKNIENTEADASKTFGNVGSGKVIPGDKVVVLSSGLLEVFTKENLLQDLAFAKEAKQFQGIFKTKQKQLSRHAGSLFAVLVEDEGEEPAGGEQEKPGDRSTTEKFRKLATNSPLRMPSVSVPRFSTPPVPSFPSVSNIASKPLSAMKQKLPKIQAPSFGSPLTSSNPKLVTKRKIGLLAVFTILLAGGFFLFQDERNEVAQEGRDALETAKNIQLQATYALQEKDQTKANELLQKARDTLMPYLDTNIPSKQEIVLVVQEIEEELRVINKIELIEQPRLVFDIQQVVADFEPTRVMLLEDRLLYTYTPFSSQLYVIDLDSSTGSTSTGSRNLKQGLAFQETVVFFAEPDMLLSLKEDGTWTDETSLASLPPDFAPQMLKAFGNSLYVFDSASGKLLRFADPFSQNEEPTLWLEEEFEERTQGANDFAIDGHIWFVHDGLEIQRYFKGSYRESIELDLFPRAQGITRIVTDFDLPYLYLLDPAENRLIILTKFGDVVKQYQSSAFSSLTDFVVSSSGNIVYLLSGEKIYMIDNIPEP